MATKSENSVTATEKKETPKEPIFTIETLRNNSAKLFDCSSSTFDGAFFNASKAEYSISEAREIIKKFLGKGVGK